MPEGVIEEGGYVRVLDRQRVVAVDAAEREHLADRQRQVERAIVGEVEVPHVGDREAVRRRRACLQQ